VKAIVRFASGDAQVQAVLDSMKEGQAVLIIQPEMTPVLAVRDVIGWALEFMSGDGDATNGEITISTRELTDGMEVELQYPD
jgi:hypothetical protein